MVSALSSWAPGISSDKEWREWAMGKRQIEISTASPSLKDFTDSLFRRRLSQISRMTIQVVHDTMLRYGAHARTACNGEGINEMPIVFVSMRGELSRELSISKMAVRDGEILPASFSLSVFNAPIALASIALDLHGGYTAVYPADGDFGTAFKAASSMLASCHRVMLVYADEAVPDEYSELMDAVDDGGERLSPLSFACVIANGDEGGNTEGMGQVAHTMLCCEDVKHDAKDFLKEVILNCKGWGI